MSPLALLYVLFASSPLLNNWHHESTSPSTWNAMPFEHESFEHYSPSANWGEEKNTFEPEHLNWLLRKAVRSTEYPTSIRSIIAEMTGRRFFNNEEPRMFETESMLLSPVVRKNVVHMIRRIAEVNPIMIEKILSCPITRKYVKKVVRNVEPETLYQIEKIVRKNFPTMIREKIARRVLKNLLTKSVFGERRSILSEMYPTESIFGESRHFNVEEPMTKIIRKLIREVRNHREVSPVEELFSTRRYESVSPVEELLSMITRRHESENLFSTRRHSEEPMTKIVRRLIREVRDHREVSPVEQIFSGRRHWNVKSLLRNVEQPESLRFLVESILRTVEPEHLTRRHNVESVLRNVMSTRRSVHSEVYPTESIFGERSYEPEHFEVLSKALRRIVKSVSKKSVSTKKICRACENICESPMTSEYSMYPVESKVCRVCEKVCEKENVYGKSFEQKLLKKMIKSSKKYERVLF